MSKYVAKVGSWTTPNETTGSIQNTSTNITIEVTSNAEANEGLTIAPMQIINFDGTIYVRSSGKKDATFTVVPFKVAAGGGGGGGGSQYSLPTASSSVKGGIKIGDNLKMTGEVLSAVKQISDYSSGVSYKVGDIVVYQNKLYKCITAYTSGKVFDASKFELISGSSETVLYDWESNKSYTKNELVYYASSIYRCKTSHISSSFSSDSVNWELIYSNIGDWKSNIYYSVGANIIKDNSFYVCKTAHTSSSTFNEANWIKISGSDSYKIVDWGTGIKYFVDDVVYSGNSILRCKVAHTSSSTSLSADISNWELLYSDIAEWEPSTYYIEKCIVSNGNKLYRCNTSHTSGSSFSDTNWDLFGSFSIGYWMSSKEYDVGDIVIYGGTLFRCNTHHTSNTFDVDNSNWDIIYSYIPNWSPNIYYNVGSTVLNGGKFFVCKTAHTSGTVFNSADWTEIGGGSSGISDWASYTSYKVNDIVYYNDSLFRCIANHTSSSIFSSDNTNWSLMCADIKLWKPSSYYVVGSVVINSNVLYRCNISHMSGPSFDIFEKANWDIIGSSASSVTGWEVNETYSLNDVIEYDGDLYKCVVAHTSGTLFDSAERKNWIHIGRPNIVNWNTSFNYQSDDLVVYENSLYRCTVSHISDSSDFSNDASNWELVYADLKSWGSGRYYTVGVCVIDSNRYIWRCTNSHTSGISFDSAEKSNWEMVGGDPDSLTAAQVSALIANFNPAGDGLMKLDNWEANHGYTVKQVTLYNNKMYRCKTAHTSGSTFDATERANWDEVVGGSGTSIDDWVSGTNYTVGDFVIYHKKIYQCTVANADASFNPIKWVEIGGIYDYSSGIDYMVGELVFYGNRLYRCKAAHTSTTTFDESKWALIDSGRVKVEDWATSTNYKVNEIVLYNNIIYRCVAVHTSSSFVSDISNWERIDNISDWSANTDYFVGDYLYYDKNIYRVTTSFTSTTTFSSTNLEMLGGTPLTTAEENAIINNFTPTATAFNNVSNLYTTEERAIGIWIDGKVLYQKTVQVVLPNASGAQPFSYISSVPWSSVDTLVSSDGFVIRSDGWTVENRFYYNNNNQFSFHFNKLTSSLFFYVESGSPSTAGQLATLTFKYTKV